MDDSLCAAKGVMVGLAMATVLFWLPVAIVVALV